MGKDVLHAECDTQTLPNPAEQLNRQNALPTQSGREKYPTPPPITHTAVSPALSEVPPDACDPLQSPDPVTPACPASHWGQRQFSKMHQPAWNHVFREFGLQVRKETRFLQRLGRDVVADEIGLGRSTFCLGVFQQHHTVLYAFIGG